MAESRETPPRELESTVWIVSARTGPNGIKGRLVLRDGSLVFRSEGGGESTFPLAQVQRFRRVLGSPILEITVRSETAPVVGFYFARPPTLEGEGRMRQRHARTAAVASLRRWNAVKKEEVKAWLAAIRQARAQADPG